MRIIHLAGAALLASLGVAQAQPVSETPGISRDAARPTTPPNPGPNTPAGVIPGMNPGTGTPGRVGAVPLSPGTNTPAGVIQGTNPAMTGQGHAGAEAGTVPIAPSPGVPPQGEARGMPMQPAQTGLAPGDRARDAMGMGAGRPGTSMPPGSIAGQAPGMGATATPGAALGAPSGATAPGR
ncbi:MAG: hypothetical protein K5Q68_08120 [Roseococcus sp.]|nr:hypothetical protein [Roseococcus sp.]